MLKWWGPAIIFKVFFFFFFRHTVFQTFNFFDAGDIGDTLVYAYAAVGLHVSREATLHIVSFAKIKLMRDTKAIKMSDLHAILNTYTPMKHSQGDRPQVWGHIAPSRGFIPPPHNRKRLAVQFV